MRAFGCLTRLALVLSVSLLLSNCMTDASQSVKPMAAEQPASSSALALASTNAVAADYQISPRDILDISVFQVPDLNKTVQVSDDGYITLPLIGKTQVADKSTREAEQIIADKLRKTYMQSPQVSVLVKQYGQRITISGEVKTPRVMAIDGKVTLTEAVANAGGLGDLADTKRVHIARSKNQHIHDEVYDLDAIQAGQVADPVLHGGDLVVVEQSGVKVVIKDLKDMLPFAILAPLL
jgi:polysaccharide biosynthesis/export protein